MDVGGGPLAAMASPTYRRLFTSASIVIFGVMGQAVARAWLARELTGSNAGLGGVMLVFGVAMLIATPLGGIAADRYDKRSVLIIAVVALAISSAGVGTAVVTDAIQYWMLLAASAVQAAAFAFYLPARIAFIAESVPPLALSNAVVLAQVAQEATRVIAPALAGVLLGISWFGVGGVFLLGAASSTLALVFLSRLPRSAQHQRRGASPLAELADVVAYMRSVPGLGMIALFTVGVVMVGFPYLTFLPTIADERFDVGALGFGALSAVAGLGALSAGVLDARTSRRRRPWRTLTLSAAAFGVTTLALAAAPSFAVALVAVAGVGASGLLFQTSSQSLMLQMSAFEYHGRLQSFVILGFSGFGLAALPLGYLADATSVGFALAAMGIVVLAMTAVFVAVAWRLRRNARAVTIG